MWTQQQRYCTACAAASLLGFVALALYLDPTGMTRLNPFRGEDCRTYEQQRPFNEQQQTDKKVSSNEGGEPSAEQHARNAAAQAPEHQGSEADYYACRLAIYTHQLALFTGALVVVTVILIGTGIYQGVHLSRAANAAKDSADALPVLERSYVFMEIDPTSIAELWSILRQSVKPDDIVIRYRTSTMAKHRRSLRR